MKRYEMLESLALRGSENRRLRPTPFWVVFHLGWFVRREVRLELGVFAE